MSYHIYTTEGIILKRAPFGEANLLLYILTADLGLIMASARSARVAASKLRPALQEYSHVTVSCVKGKGGWKVTNVAAIQNFYFGYPEYTHNVLARIVSLLIQMIPGESNHPAVFTIVKDSLNQIKELKDTQMEFFEILVVLQVLFELGYIAKDIVTEKYIDRASVFDMGIFESISTDKIELIQIINNAIKVSQL